MNDPRKTYGSKDITFIVPTKDRPHKLKDLLASLAGQTVPVGRVIVIDGGKSVKDVVMEFAGVLSAEHHVCDPPGQIRQKKMGIGLLDEQTPLVGFLDDDIVMEPDALENMIKLWNNTELNTAGIGFNIVNTPDPGFIKFLSKLSPGRRVPGRVLPSGINTSFQNISSGVRTQWLGGGYTVWKKNVLDEFSQEDLKTRWAIGEDVRFSYPVGKKFPLHVCREARVRHEHVYDQTTGNNVHIYQGKKQALAVFYFVRSHPELSPVKCLLSLSISVAAKIALGLLTLNLQPISFSLGRAAGIFTCVRSLLGSADLRKELED